MSNDRNLPPPPKQIELAYRGDELVIAVQGSGRRASVIITHKEMADHDIIELCIMLAERFNYLAEKITAQVKGE